MTTRCFGRAWPSSWAPLPTWRWSPKPRTGCRPSDSATAPARRRPHGRPDARDRWDRGHPAARRSTCPDTRILILTTFQYDDYVWGALRAGASGFLLKRASPERLLDAVRTVAAGEALLDPAVTRDLVHHYSRPGLPGSRAPPRPGNSTGSPSANGRSSPGRPGPLQPEIADLLVIAESTAKTHVKRILAKIDAHDRAQAVVFVYRSGMIVDPSWRAPGPPHADSLPSRHAR